MTPKILVVDDEPAIADSVTYALRHEGFDVDVVGDGADAVAALREHRYDLMVLDLLLPSVGGLDICRSVRAGSDLPIIMLTARDAELERVVGLELGADDYVTNRSRSRSSSAVCAHSSGGARSTARPQGRASKSARFGSTSPRTSSRSTVRLCP